MDGQSRKVRSSLLFSNWPCWKARLACNVMQLPATAGTIQNKDGSTRRSFISFRNCPPGLGAGLRDRVGSGLLIGGFGYVLRRPPFPGNQHFVPSFQHDFDSLHFMTCGGGAKVRRPHRWHQQPMRYTRTYIGFYGGNRVLFSSS